ncbi:Enoyl-CoA delta isomerase-like protein [Paramyrothecium foliicola]|nr:Enoyl-CoA delta isomerase-like protein [Paramyrothecium foliicola]
MAAAAAAAPLFTLPIPPCDPPKHPGGSIVCTEPRPGVYLLTFESPPDNRITTAFCKTLLAALDVIEFGYRPGVVVTTSAIGKFYSNGLDLEHAINTEGYWALLYDVWRRFLTYPMPTIALMNGHAFAGGLMLAMAHDYRLAPSPRGFLCVNELLFGAPLKPPMAAIFRHKLPAATYRTLVLEARRYGADEALAAGIVDGIAPRGLDDALAFIEERGLVEKPKSGVYGTLKAEMHKDLIYYLRNPGLDAEEARFAETQNVEAERKEFGRVWYEQWQKDHKAKL